MNFKKILAISSILFSFQVFSQNIKDSVTIKSLSQYPPELIKTDEYGNPYYYDERQRAKIYEIEGETVVVMDELRLRSKPNFNNQLDQNYYYFLNTGMQHAHIIPCIAG